MNQAFKPDGYNSLSPYLIVDDAQKLMDLLKEVFGAKELRRYDNEDGTIMHAEIQIDDSVMMIADASKQYPAVSHLLHLYVPNVDEVFDRAVQSGCTSMEKPVQRGDLDKRGTFKDFGGNI